MPTHNPNLPPDLDAVTAANWVKNARKWLDAAFKGDREGLAPSLGTGFWQNWRSQSSASIPLVLLVIHGHDASMLEYLEADGLEYQEVVSGKPLIHWLANKSEESSLGWMEVLHRRGVDWQVPDSSGKTFIQGMVSRQRHQALALLHGWGIPLPSTPDPMLLASWCGKRLKPTLEQLQRMGVRPTSGTETQFFIAAIASGLPLDCKEFLDQWGMRCPANADVMMASLTPGKTRKPWAEYLAEAGVCPDDLCSDGQSILSKVNESLSRRYWSPDERDRYQAFVDSVFSKAIRSRLEQSIPPSPTVATSPRARL